MRAIQQQWLPCDGAAPVDVAFSGSAANATFPSFFSLFACAKLGISISLFQWTCKNSKSSSQCTQQAHEDPTQLCLEDFSFKKNPAGALSNHIRRRAVS